MSRNAKAFEKIRLQFDQVKAELLPRVVQALAEAAKAQIAVQFDAAVDPDGNPWDPNVMNTRTLFRTGTLAKDFFVEITEGGFRVYTTRYYAVMLQGRRRMLPQRRRVGKVWLRVFRAAAKKAKKQLAEDAKVKRPRGRPKKKI